jgi:hypothetical protein
MVQYSKHQISNGDGIQKQNKYKNQSYGNCSCIHVRMMYIIKLNKSLEMRGKYVK